MNAAQIQSRLYTIERLLKTSSQTSIVTELPPSGEEGILYIFDRNMYLWDGAKYIVLFDTIQLSNTVWVNLDLTVSDASQRIFKSYDEAIAWILANDTPSAINQWQVMLPGGLIPALSVYPYIRISCIAGTTIAKVDTTVVYSSNTDFFAAIIQNAQILELNVTTENGVLMLRDCSVTNTVSNGLTSECIMYVSDCLFLGGDFISYNFYTCKNTQFVAFSSIINCWGTFNNCTGIAIGDVSGKTTYVVDGVAIIRSKIYGTISIFNSIINHVGTTTLQSGSNVKMYSVNADNVLTITVPIDAVLLTEVVSPNITVVTPEGHPEVWTHKGEKYNNANSKLASTDVDSAITELAGQIIKIGEFDYTDLNIANKPTITIYFSDAKPKDKLFVQGFMVIDEEFEEDYYYESGNNITRFICSETFIKATNIPNSDIRDIECVITLNANDQDWIAGKASVYIEVKPFPTLA